MRSRLLCCVLTVLAVLCLAPAAMAAHRRVPFGFMGTVLNPTVSLQLTQDQTSDQMGLMARSGVESVRSNIYWSATEPFPGQYNFTEADKLVLGAARHGLSLLPIIEFTPQWAAPKKPIPADYLPTDPSTFTSFMTAMVRRYGPHGTLWKLFPQLRRYAVRDWQIWNEPAGNYDWRSQPWASTYTQLLRAGYKGIHRSDPGATVVSGAMVGLNGKDRTPWAETDALYRAGAGKYFDALAVNAFTNVRSSATLAVKQSVQLIANVRREMRKHGDGTKPIWVTEVTWPASLGKIPTKDYAGFETTTAGQEQRLSGYYRYVATHRSLHIARVFWSTWATSYSLKRTFGDIPTFAYSGLVRWPGGDVFHPLPVLGTYQRTAAALEGCAKTSDAAVCR